MAAVIANEFTEAADELYLHALVEIGLVLFIITLIVNVLSRAADLVDGAGSAGRGTRRRPQPAAERGMSDALAPRLLSSLFVAFCAAVGAARAGAARVRSCSSWSRRASRR